MMFPTKIIHNSLNENNSKINPSESFNKDSSCKEDENCKAKARIDNFVDIICDNSPIRISAILHAAEISPLVLGNSFSSPEKIKKTNFLTNNKPRTTLDTTIKTPAIKSNMLETMALDIVNHNLSVKKQRKELFKKGLAERQEVLLKENRKRQEILEKSLNKRNSWIYNKLENDKNIYEAAEQFINQTAEQSDVQIKKILIEKENKLKQISYEAISKYQIKFKEGYQKLTEILLSFDKNTINCEQYNNNLKELIASFENLIKKIKNYEIGPSEILYAEVLCNRIRNLEHKLIADAKKVKQQQQLSLETEKTLNAPPLSQSTQGIIIKPNIKPIEKSADIPDTNNKISISGKNDVGVSIDSLNFYNNIMSFYNEKIEAIKPLQNDENMKKLKVAYKRTLNIAVSSICAVSPQHLQDKFDKIFNFITGKNVKTSISDVNVLDHPLGKDFSLVLLANILVKQGDTEVSSNAKAAFPIATIIVSIWNRLPDFGKIFLGQIFKESPYLVPYFITKHKDQSNESYLKSLGYQMIDGVGLEKHDVFLTRQAGIMRLYAAIMVTNGRRADEQLHPYGIENGWRWISNFINLCPLPDICATLLYEFLQTAGYEMWSTFGQQFHKLLIFTQQQYIPQLSKMEDREPPKLRLEGYLQQILQKKNIDKPNGTLSKNYW